MDDEVVERGEHRVYPPTLMELRHAWHCAQGVRIEAAEVRLTANQRWEAACDRQSRAEAEYWKAFHKAAKESAE